MVYPLHGRDGRGLDGGDGDPSVWKNRVPYVLDF